MLASKVLFAFVAIRYLIPSANVLLHDNQQTDSIRASMFPALFSDA